MPKRRSANEGTIYQLPSGTWRAQVSLSGRRLSHTSDTQSQAREWIRDTLAQIEQGLTYSSTTTTLGEFITAWLEGRKGALRTLTYFTYERVIRLYIVPGIGKLLFRDLTPVAIQKFYDNLTSSGHSAHHVHYAHTLIHNCLDQAMRLGLVSRNVSDLCNVPAERRHEEISVWDENQVNQFLVSIHNHPDANFFYLAFATGMRRGELLGLQWKDVDWLARTVTVSRQVIQPQRGTWSYGEPKTKQGWRTIEVGQNIIEHLRDQQTKSDAIRRKAANRWHENNLIFPNQFGDPRRGSVIGANFRQLASAAGLPEIRFHDIRHTAATLMLGHGIPPVIVAGILGHTMTVLMTTYAHYIPSMQGAAAALMNTLISPVAVDLNRTTDSGCTRSAHDGEKS